jgi:hypothetical protein
MGISHLYLTRLELAAIRSRGVRASLGLRRLFRRRQGPDRGICSQLTRLKFALQESRGSDLDISIRVDHMIPQDIRRLFYWGLTLIAKHTNQIRSMRVTSPRGDPALDFLISLISTSKHVSTLIHAFDGHYFEHDIGVNVLDELADLFSAHPPFQVFPWTSSRLLSTEYLATNLHTLFEISHRVLATVRGLVIEDGRNDWDNCLKILAASHNLRVLGLRTDSWRNDAQSLPLGETGQLRPALPLAKLQSLSIIINVGDVPNLLERVAFPSLEQLAIDIRYGHMEGAHRTAPGTTKPANLPSLRFLTVKYLPRDYWWLMMLFQMRPASKTIYIGRQFPRNDRPHIE